MIYFKQTKKKTVILSLSRMVQLYIWLTNLIKWFILESDRSGRVKVAPELTINMFWILFLSAHTCWGIQGYHDWLKPDDCVTSRMCMPLWSVLKAFSPTRTSGKMEADLLWVLRSHNFTRTLSCPGPCCLPSALAATSETLHKSKCRKTLFYALAPSWYSQTDLAGDFGTKI